MGWMLSLGPTMRGEIKFKSNKWTKRTTKRTLAAINGLSVRPMSKAGIVEMNGPQKGIKLKKKANNARTKA